MISGQALITIMAIVLLSSTSTVPSADAATLMIDPAQWTGAVGVDVGGTPHDVALMNGSCMTMLAGCDTSSDFIFNRSEAEDTSLALLDQVFINAALNANSPQGLAMGCSWSFVCWTMTPEEMANIAILVRAVQNTNIGNIDKVFLAGRGVNPPASGYKYSWAVWTAAAVSPPSPVPLPATFILLGSGLAGLVFVHRRKKSQ